MAAICSSFLGETARNQILSTAGWDGSTMGEKELTDATPGSFQNPQGNSARAELDQASVPQGARPASRPIRLRNGAQEAQDSQSQRRRGSRAAGRLTSSVQYLCPSILGQILDLTLRRG
jgi:hypothetical protein